MKWISPIFLIVTLLATVGNMTTVEAVNDNNMAALFKVRRLSVEDAGSEEYDGLSFDENKGFKSMSLDQPLSLDDINPTADAEPDHGIWNWWFVFQDSKYFIPVIVAAGVLVLGCGLCCAIHCYRRRRAARAEAAAELPVTAPPPPDTVRPAPPVAPAPKCGCQGKVTKGETSSKNINIPTMKPVAPMELYATRALTASTAFDSSMPTDPQAAIQAIV